MDAFKNFSKSTLAAGISSSATSLTVAAGQGARFPVAPFNAVIWNRTDFADPSDDPNVEIVRVTAIASDVFTITRAQETTAGVAHNTGGKVYGIIAALTAKTLNVGFLINGVESNPVADVPVLRGTLASGTLIPLRFSQTQDPLCGPFMWLIASAVNPGPTSRRDTYMQFGVNPGGEADGMRFYNAIETYWNPGGSQVQIETYYDYLDPFNGGGAVAIRPFGITLRRDIKDIQLDCFTSRFNIFDWPNHAGADHPFVAAVYPDLYVHDGNLMIDSGANSTVNRGVLISSYIAVGFDRTINRLFLGDNSQNIVPLGSFWGPFNFGTPNIEPTNASTWPYELSVGFRGSAITDLVLLQRSNASMVRWFYFQSLDGSNAGDLSYDGHLRWGSGIGGAAPDVGLKRSAANTWRTTDGGGGFGNIEVGTLYLNDGSVKQVTYGAAGSGGTGKKVLCIDN